MEYARTISKDQTGRGTFSRRDVVRLGAAVLAGAATGPFVWTPARAQGFNWERFRGKELYLLLQNNPCINALEQHIPEFEAISGIKVNWESPNDTQSRQKIMVTLVSGSSSMDVFFTGLHVEKRRFSKAGWYAPLNRFLEDKSLTSPDYDWNDFPPSVRGAMTTQDRTIVALPAFVDSEILYYRKDLYAEKGLKPPKTLQEMEQHAALFHAPPRMYGFVARGRKNASASPFSSILFAMGGTFLTKDGKAALDTKECVAAIDYFAGMLRRYGPPGVVNYNWMEASSTFAQGQAALYSDGLLFAGMFEDSSKSKIVGKVGYALPPAGPAGQVSRFFCNGLAISAHSRNKEAAYLFMQWATNKQNNVRQVLAGVPTTRVSAWNHPDAKSNSRMPAEWAQACEASLKIAREGLPQIVGVNEYRDIIGIAIEATIEGTPAAQAAARAQKEFQEMLDKTEI